MQAFIGTLVDTPVLGSLRIRHDYLLIVDPKGFIVHLDHSTSSSSQAFLETLPDGPVRLPKGSFLLPTFCDLHFHAPQFLYQGTGLHLPLLQWLNQYAYKAEERLDADPALAKTVYHRLSQRLIESGTGLVVLFGTLRTETNLILAQVMQSAGIRAFVGKVSMDISTRPTYVEASTEESISAAESFVTQCRLLLSDVPQSRHFIEPIITPRFVPTCSDQLLRQLGLLVEKVNLRVQSHMAEASDQMEWVRSHRGCDDIEIFAKSNLLTARTIQAHCTFLSDQDLAAMKRAGSSIAHCPLSNSYFSTRPFPLREALENGISVGLGSDIAGGYSVDIMNSMRQAVIVSRMREGQRSSASVDDMAETRHSLAIDWKEALFLATRGGAQAMQLPIGHFDLGVPFDAQERSLMNLPVSLVDWRTGQGIGALDFLDDDANNWQVTATAVEKWWCLGDGRNRNAMWTQGEKRM